MEILGNSRIPGKKIYVCWPPWVVFDLGPDEIFFFIEEYHRLIFGVLGCLWERTVLVLVGFCVVNY
jgi:hypothetical protein